MLPIEILANRKFFLGMKPAQFLHNYWQKHPLLIRNALANWQSPITPNDLAGLACEEMALSRLVLHTPKHDRWTLQSGPFSEAHFSKLPKTHWTLLVQDVEKWDMDVAALLNHFAFLPSWRIDDIMVSYAVDGGSVGAHIDQYDVFLVQGLGQRRWQISTDTKASKEFRADSELKLLKTFNPSHEWVLEPGDILYLPAGVAHHGVAMGECMTFSVGMRAPSQAEMILDLAEYLAEPLGEELRYIDPDLAVVKRMGEIDADALRRVQESLRALMPAPHTSPASNREGQIPSPAASGGKLGWGFNETQLADWFGRFITRYRSAQLASPPSRPIDAASLQKKMQAGAQLVRHPWARFAWRAVPRGAVLYASGQAYLCSTQCAQLICERGNLNLNALVNLQTRDQLALLQMINAGHLVISRLPRKRRSTA